jgi:hypothetical protein
MKQPKIKEKHLRTTWLVVGECHLPILKNGILRGYRVYHAPDREHRTRKQAERTAARYRRNGYRAYVRRRDEVMVYRDGRKTGRDWHITAYNRNGSKEKWF